MKLEQLLRTAAVTEYRLIASMTAVMIRDYYVRVGVEIAAGLPASLESR